MNAFGHRRAIDRLGSRDASRRAIVLAVLPPDTLPERPPDCVLLLTWNFAAEILTQQREFRRMRGTV
jgi:hypothetical protein